MPFRHGNTYRALRWLAAASLCTALYVGEASGQFENDVPGESPETPAQTITQQKDTLTLPVTPSEPAESVASPEIYEPDCDHPDSREEADLCAQRRMANAAEDTIKWIRLSVDWAERQYYATIGEIIALVVTILVAALAVGAAFRANRIAGQSAKRQLRAYAGTKDARITMTDEGELSYRVRYKNYGQTPAFNLIVRTSCTATPLPLNIPLTSDTIADQDKSVGILWPGEPVQNTGTLFVPGTQTPGRFTPEYREDIAAGRAAIFLHGDITYLDIFRKPRKTIFRLMYTGPWGGNQSLIFCDDGNDAD